MQGGGADSDAEILYITRTTTITCTPPLSGDWTITVPCTISSSISAPANVTVQNNVVVTISSAGTLNIDFSQFSLTVNSGSGVLVQSGGTIT